MRINSIGNSVLYNASNRDVFMDIFGVYELAEPKIKFDVIYADCIYDSMDFDWIYWCYECLKDNGIFFVQTDYHTVAEYKYALDRLYGFNVLKGGFVNWIITIQEWGGTSKRFFPRKHDDILMYAKGKDYKFYPERIQIEKVTKGTDFDKKGTGLKTPCDVFYDLGNFSTMSKERVKGVDEKNIQWQKPLKLINRLLLSTTDEGDFVLDPFMGSGTTGVWCAQNKRNFHGIEIDEEVYNIAKKRIEEEVYKMLGGNTARGEKDNNPPRHTIRESMGT